MGFVATLKTQMRRCFPPHGAASNARAYSPMLLLISVIRFLGNGSHCVPELIVLEVVLSLGFSRQANNWWDMMALYSAFVLSTSCTILSEVRHVDMSWGWVGVMLLVQMPLQMMYVLPYVADKLLLNIPVAGALCFPTAYTGLQMLLVYVSPGGSWGVAGYCASFGTPRTLALLSLAGLSGVHFLLAAASSVLLTYTGRAMGEGYYYEEEEEEYGTDVVDGPVDETSLHSRAQCEVNNMSPDRQTSFVSQNDGDWLEEEEGVVPMKVQWRVFLLFLFGILLYGSFYNAAPSFFGGQSTSNTINLSCVAVANGHVVSPDSLLQLTQQLSRNGSQMVMWSERPCTIRKQDEGRLMKNATKLAVATDTYIGLSYELSEPSGNNSLFSLIDPQGNGSVQLQVGRVHASPFGKGPGDAGPVRRAVKTPMGKVGAIMGFDLFFPQFVQKVAAKGVRLILAPAEDYGPIYAIQWNQAALRAAEQGTTIAFCSSTQGLLVMDPFGSVVVHVPLTESGKEVVLLSSTITLQERTTLYSLTGDAFGFLCLALAILCLIIGKVQVQDSNLAAWMVSRWARQLRAPSQHRPPAPALPEESYAREANEGYDDDHEESPASLENAPPRATSGPNFA